MFFAGGSHEKEALRLPVARADAFGAITPSSAIVAVASPAVDAGSESYIVYIVKEMALLRQRQRR